MKDLEDILADIAPFADLGTDAPILSRLPDGIVCRLHRDGRKIDLIFKDDGTVRERGFDGERLHSSFTALLASPSFANLGRWADSQKVLLKTRVESETIETKGIFADTKQAGGVELFDDVLAGNITASFLPRVLVALIDGPAGIGKTSVIRSLAFRRACTYRLKQRPLLLHVESRGRVLQNISDLMAFSLQTLRLSVTYDQIPALVRNGLITLAIDGFDELGDPNGYELAWAQINDLISASRGRGVLIFAGRETFLSEDRLRKALSAIDARLDAIKSLTLEPIRPQVARSWLAANGWNETELGSEAAEPLFEDGSYALRPFFLSELSRESVGAQIANGNIEDLLSFLVDAMITREAKKFGRDIEVVTSAEQRMEFVSRLMQEVARDLAENQSDAIPAESVSWLAEVAAYDLVPEELTGILKNRAGVVAFLTEDDRRGYKRFTHQQIANFFLAQATIRSIGEGELPKFIRRNIVGPEFLENFCDVFRKCDQRMVDIFVEHAMQHLLSTAGQDRSKRNLGSLVLAACCVAAPTVTPNLRDISFDDVFLRESVSNLVMEDCTIAQLYARSTDLRNIKFGKNCFIMSLIADVGTIIPPKFPEPQIISMPNITLTSPGDKILWHYEHQYFEDVDALTEFYAQIKEFPLFDLLARVARYKPFWLKDGEERSARRILDDEGWNLVKGLLIKHGFLVERYDVPAAGRPGSFFHIKNRQALLSIKDIPQSLLDDMIDESLRMESRRNDSRTS